METSLQAITRSQCGLKKRQWLSLMALGAVVLGGSARAAEKVWNSTTTDTLWSTAANWLPVGAPGASDNVTFTNVGFAELKLADGGLVSSEVDAGFNSAISSLAFRNIQGFHNVNLVKALGVQSTATTGLAFTAQDGMPVVLQVGSGSSDAVADAVYTTIAGVSLTVNNPNAVISVMQKSTAAGAHRATLDLSQLNFFTATVSNVLVGFGHDFNLPDTSARRPSGTLILGTSNTITSELILIADAYQNANNQHCFVYLGEKNQLNVEKIRIGLHKCPGSMLVNGGLVAPSAVFRNKAGTGRQIAWEVGDQYETVYLGYFASGAATGILDLTGANVDALVETITLGRGQTNAPIRNGDGVGTLTFGAGKIDVNNLQMGIQLTGSGTTGRGTLNVNNDDGMGGTMKVNNNVLMAAGLPQTTEVTNATVLDIAQGTINVNGGKLEVAGDIVDGGGNTTINLTLGGAIDMKPGADATAGNVTVDTLNISDGSITSYGTLGVTTIGFPAATTQFTVNATETLAPVAVNRIGDLNVAGALTLRGTLDIDAKKTGGVLTADKVVATGTIDLGGTLRVGVSGDALAVGDKFTILSGTTANAFASVSLPSPGPGMTWTNKTAVDGTIEVILAPVVPPVEKIWTGGAGDTLWSTAGNWLPTGAPLETDNVTFTNIGFADLKLSDGGPINSVVDANTTINSLAFQNIQGFHNVNLTKPLAALSTSTTELAFTAIDGTPAVLFVGTGKQDGAADAVYTTIVGDSLTVNNPNAVISVVQASTTSGAHRATLDLSGLNFFTATVSNVLVGFGHDFNLTNAMRPSGTLVLGVSNVITSELILIADAYQNANNQQCFIYLGQDNKLNVERIRIGLHKCPGTMGITAGLTSSSAVFRNKAGTGRQIAWELGDQYETVYTGYFASGAATGLLDLTGAAVDAMVETITLGRGQTNAPIRNGDGVGTLTFGAGTIDVNNLQLGVQLTGSGTTGRGTLNVNNDDGVGGTMKVNNNVLMAAGLPQTTEVTNATTLDIAQATINVNGGKLEVAGDIVDGGGNTTINLTLGGTIDMKPGADATAGNVTVDTLNISDGSITRYGTLGVTTIAFPGATTQFTVNATETLAPVAVDKIGDLNVAGALTLRGSLDVDVKKTGGVLTADKVIATGTIDLGGTLRVRVSGDALALGDKFTILSGTTANAFETLVLPSPGAGLTWTNKTAVDGTIEVIAGGGTTNPTLAISKSGNSITVSWPLSFTTFTLRSQVNWNGNWSPVPGVVNNSVTLPIDPANSVVVFQLFQQ